METGLNMLASIIEEHADVIKARWRALLTSAGATGGGRIKDAELQKQCGDFLSALGSGLSAGAS